MQSVPHFDCENLGSDFENKKQDVGIRKGFKFVCVGLDIGSLVFMELSDWQKIYCRLSVVNRHIGCFVEVGNYLVCCSGAAG